MVQITDLDRDLVKQIDRKLRLWTQDSFDLFAMVDREQVASACIIETLLSNLCAGLVNCGANDDDVVDLVVERMDAARKANARLIAKRKALNQ